RATFGNGVRDVGAALRAEFAPVDERSTAPTTGPRDRPPNRRVQRTRDVEDVVAVCSVELKRNERGRFQIARQINDASASIPAHLAQHFMAAGSGIANGSEQLVVLIATPQRYGGHSTRPNVLLHD